MELLAKAHLAGIHPSLVVEPDNTNSLLEANGIATGTAVRTISAHVAYARLKHTVPHFSTPVFEECRRLAERRNAELHSGDAAFAAMPYDAWEGDFWNAAELLLSNMGSDLQQWLGADAQAPKALLRAYRRAESTAARQRVKHHASEFKKSDLGKLSKAKFEALVHETLHRPIERSAFRYDYGFYWRQECPACKTIGALAGDEAWEELADDQRDADDGYEIIERGFAPVEFHCPTCGLSLVGEAAVSAAGLADEFVDTEEREITYEPDYGND